LNKYLIIQIILILLVHSAYGKYYFYKPENDFGSDMQFNPVSAFVNGTYDILRNTSNKKNIFKINYYKGANNVLYNISHAQSVLEKLEYRSQFDFWRYEVFPENLNKKSGNWIPNYQTHLIGEGMIYRKLSEWYDYHGYQYPYLCGMLTTAAFQFANEVVEDNGYNYYPNDPIADLLIFNPSGYLLFSIDPVADFFSSKAHLFSWAGQPLINPANGSMTNVGNSYAVKIDIPKLDKVQLFYSWSIFGLTGLSYKAADSLNYSFGSGIKARMLNNIFIGSRIMLGAETVPFFGFFIDRNESMLISLTQTGIKEPDFALNLYPGIVKGNNLGLYIAYSEKYSIHLGVNYSASPLGLFAGSFF